MIIPKIFYGETLVYSSLDQFYIKTFFGVCLNQDQSANTLSLYMQIEYPGLRKYLMMDNTDWILPPCLSVFNKLDVMLLTVNVVY